MFDQVVDAFRKAIDSSMQLQQEMLRQFVQLWSQVPGIPTTGSAVGNNWTDQVNTIQRKCTQTITDLLNRHREALDAQYRAGIRTIEDAFRVGEAKDPEQFRKLTENLWRQSLDSMKTVIESQMLDLQTVTQKGLEDVTKGITTDK